MSQDKPLKKSDKTRFLIMNSFIEIMQTKNLESITVKSIVEKCDITRGTFYLYFSDINELITCIEDILLEAIPLITDLSTSSGFSKLPSAEECVPNQWEVALFDYYEKNAFWLNTLLGPHGDHQFQKKIKDQMKNRLKDQMKNDGVPNDSFRTYFENVIPEMFLLLAKEWSTKQGLYDLDKNALAHIISTIRIGAKYKAYIERAN